MDELFATGVLNYDDLMTLARELNKSYGLPTNEEQLNKDKRQQKMITFVVVSIFLVLILFTKLHTIIDLNNKIISSFESGDYFPPLLTIFFLGSVSYLIIFHLDFKRKPRKRDMVRISLFEEGISIVERRHKKSISWENVLEVRVLPSLVGIQVKEAEQKSYLIIPNRFFEDRIMKDKIVTYCNSKIKKE